MRQTLLLAVFFIGCNFISAQPGKLDFSFGKKGIVKTDFGASGNIYGAFGRQVLTAPDETSYLIFETNDQASIIHLLADGSKDFSYGVKGYAHIIAGYAVMQRDGKIVVAGGNTIARYNTDGSPDHTFSKDGIKLSAITDINSAAIQKDGKIVVAGSAGVARCNADGSLDKTFKANIYPGESPSIAIQKDGKIILYGTFKPTDLHAPDGDYRSYAILTQLNVDGSLDLTFGKNGKSDSTGSYSVANSVELQGDGKIVVVDNNTPALARYNKNGSFDSSFSGDGIAAVNIFINENIQPLAIQKNGKIIVSGVATLNDNGEDFALARYNTNGTPDMTFGENGIQLTAFSLFNFPSGIAVQNDGKIMAAGSVSGAENISDYALARYNTDGTLDSTFSKDGKLADFVHTGYTIYNSTAIQTDGRIVVAGVANTGSGKDFAIARYNTDGTPDTTFSEDGKQTTDLGSDDEAKSVVIQTDGKIVVAGNSESTGVFPPDNKLAMARYNTDGTLDTAFGNKGKLTAIFDAQGIAKSIALQSDGKIVVAISSDNDYSSAFIVARYNADGTPDNTFSKDGIQKSNFGQEYQAAWSVTIQSDGKIVAAGSAGNYNHSAYAVARYNTDGTPDKTFSNDGKLTTDFGYTFSKATSVVLQMDGKIAVAGTVSSDKADHFALARYNTDGTSDSTFSKDGKSILNANSGSDIAASAAIQSDGKIVTGGSSDGNSALARFNANGSPDSSFGDKGKAITNTGEGVNGINAVFIFNNKLYAAGVGKYPGNIGIIARYLLDAGNTTPPTVSLTAPANNATYLAPAAHIKLSATASDSNGAITKVEFYNGNTLLHTETVVPYGFLWKNVPLGNYTLTAKAYNNSGNVTASAPVHIFVVTNKPPVVNIVKPADGQRYTAPADIYFEATASDTDGRITRVQFYNDITLLRTEYKYPYTYVWKNVPAGSYTLTAVATDNYGAVKSDFVFVKVLSSSTIVSNKPYSQNQKTASNDALSFRLSPNPAAGVVTIYTSGLQQNKPATISIISTSGIVFKTINISNAATQLDVSQLAGGVYTLKIVNGAKVQYKQFVKL